MTAGLVLATAALAGCASTVSHRALQAVDETGRPRSPIATAEASRAGKRIAIEGIALNNPEEMLDPSRQWQVFVQGEGADQSGTAVWAGRFYYPSQEAWDAEVARLSASGLRAGDRVRVVGWARAVSGKVNITEHHSPDPAMDFEITVNQPGAGLPEPELTTIAELRRFDPTRRSGGERYTGRRIRLLELCIAEGTWARNHRLLLRDTAGATLPLRLGNHPGFASGQAPQAPFDLIAIGNQERISDEGKPVPGSGLVDGYEVWLTDPAGAFLPGDTNADGRVDRTDVGPFAMALNEPERYAATISGRDPVLQADLNRAGLIDLADVQPFAVRLATSTGGSAEEIASDILRELGADPAQQLPVAAIDPGAVAGCAPPPSQRVGNLLPTLSGYGRPL